jgi:hypothetical protein
MKHKFHQPVPILHHSIHIYGLLDCTVDPFDVTFFDLWHYQKYENYFFNDSIGNLLEILGEFSFFSVFEQPNGDKIPVNP